MRNGYIKEWAAGMTDERDPSSRGRILVAAMQQFTRHGYSGTNLKSIAAEVGISTPALYWHFRSKEEIAYSALAQSLRDFLEMVKGALVSTQPSERLRQLVVAHVTWQVEQAETASAYAVAVSLQQMVGDLEEGHREEINELQRDYLDEVKAILAKGCESGEFSIADQTTAAFAIITMCEYVNTWFKPHGPLSVNEVSNLYAEFALNLVRGGRPTPPQS